MYFGINSCGVEDVVPDDSWKDYYKSKAKAIGLNSCVAYVVYGFIYFYFEGTPYGYGGDYSQNWLKEQSFGKWGSSHITQIKNVRAEYELYGDDSVHIVRLGSVRFGYRQRYPGNSLAQDLDSVDGMKIEYGENGYITKVGRYTI